MGDSSVSCIMDIGLTSKTIARSIENNASPRAHQPHYLWVAILDDQRPARAEGNKMSKEIEQTDFVAESKGHSTSLVIGGLALVAVTAGGLLLARHRARVPERQSPPPQSVGLKILAAAGAAAASFLVRHLLQRVFDERQSPAGH